ncbi:MAG: DUF2961 domain-containing protein [Bacteroidales bacterium]|nr:DUF2961 domain-containing protein [Bacteroidales bacterium]
MADRNSITRFPDPPYRLKQFSSYDRESVDPDSSGWYANADYTHFLREETNNGRREFVLFDHDGPGAIVRWWMTFAGEGSHEGTVRIYIDNSEDPLIETNILKLLSGNLLAGEPISSSVSPETDYYKRGHNLYLPIPYSQSCKITYECDSVVISDKDRKPSIYYNINYRDYDTDAKVESLNSSVLEKEKPLIKKINEALLTKQTDSYDSLKFEAIIKPGESDSIKIKQRKSAINGLRLQISSDNTEQALRSTVLEISFDGIQTIWVPAGAFFGTGYEMNSYNTRYSSVDNSGRMEAGWIMPFRKNFKMILHNYGPGEIKADIKVFIKKYKWSKQSMYFGASWHEYKGIKTAGSVYTGGSGQHFDINYVDIKGKGLYVGDAITVFNTADAWWGEGDEKIFADNDSFPSSIGTGTEDYYGYAWCRPEKFSHPFIAQPTGAGNFHPGMTVNMRYRALDAIPFFDSIRSDIELWHWVPTIINYALTSYYYVKPGYSINIKNKKDDVTGMVPHAKSDIIKPVIDSSGIIEGEYLEVMSYGSGTAQTQYSGNWDWSNGGQLWWRNAEPGEKLYLRFISPETSAYNIEAVLSKARDYGIIGFEINAEPCGTLFNAYTDGEAISRISLGKHLLIEGENILSITLAGSDSRSQPGNMAGIDYLKFSQ